MKGRPFDRLRANGNNTRQSNNVGLAGSRFRGNEDVRFTARCKAGWTVGVPAGLNSGIDNATKCTYTVRRISHRYVAGVYRRSIMVSWHWHSASGGRLSGNID